jgi:hypothetical protein
MRVTVSDITVKEISMYEVTGPGIIIIRRRITVFNLQSLKENIEECYYCAFDIIVVVSQYHSIEESDCSWYHSREITKKITSPDIIVGNI